MHRTLIYHYRHKECQDSTNGYHPWENIHVIVQGKLKFNVEMTEIKDVMISCDRAVVTNYRLAAENGHTKGSTLPHKEYGGDGMLCHMTTELNAKVLMNEGIKRMNRKFVHHTKTKTAKSRGRNAVVNVNAVDLKTGGQKLLQSQNPDVVLYEGHIPAKLVQLGN